ncbi:Asp-tRNA(Asn)/Glu-tRNA(Gln) amidotransferase subunit GatA [Desulfonatronovibrio hydrogenovorans]|uniref:Asp-tRNA(Asn)/Glu-tRNA(Gln) amidotransferase subunit GatA n=1 Tax=Desulfonatronovibrio hydrogenovorans TaxID=53245 RepID=UPI0004912630|nr:Asp-tRNA(Asn)/Glu-tRNA(Gln) amidotransferase subunit GatA [Desulfonatronovibrio hydrogenovorans]
MENMLEKKLVELRNLLHKGELTCLEVVQACLERIKVTEPEINAMLSFNEEKSLEEAGRMDDLGPDPQKPLWGVPITIKDVICTKDFPTTCGSKILENYRPCYEATLVEKLRDAGAIIIGKNNMDEFAMGSSTENSAFKTTRNPWNLERVPGGSSGGSAAGVAARQCFASIGTDTGGSIRQPASFCGITGLKPTYGRVSRFGLVAYGSSLDQAGPMTRSVADAALMTQVISGYDPRDSTSASLPVPDFSAELARRSDLKNVRVGLPREHWEEGLAPEVLEVCQEAVQAARSAGATIVDIDLPHSDYGIAAYYIIAMAEASSNLARYDGVKYGVREAGRDLLEMYCQTRSKALGEEVQRRIMIGTYVLSAGYYDAYYKKAAQIRRLILQDYQKAFDKCEVIFSPVVPTTAFKIGENIDDPLQMYLTDIFTTSQNLAGLPGLTIPAGLGRPSNMPVGIQIIGPAFEEGLILQTGNILEKILPELGRPAGLA